MSVYIRGMEMPKKCADCRFFHYEGHDAFCCKALKELIYDDGEVFKPWKKRLKNCPLIPVPEHGRLGDLDAAVELAMQYCPDDDGACSKAGSDLRELLDEIEGLPTIIPADKEGEG